MAEDDPRMQLTGFLAEEDVLAYSDGFLSMTWTVTDGGLRRALQGGPPTQVHRLSYDYTPGCKKPLSDDLGYSGGVPANPKGPPYAGAAVRQLGRMAHRCTPPVPHNIVCPGDRVRMRASPTADWQTGELVSVNQDGSEAFLVIKPDGDDKPHSFPPDQVEAEPPVAAAPAAAAAAPASPVGAAAPAAAPPPAPFPSKTVTLQRWDKKEGTAAPIKIVLGVPEAMLMGPDGRDSYEQQWKLHFKVDVTGSSVLVVMDEHGHHVPLDYAHVADGATYYWRVEAYPEDLWVIAAHPEDAQGGPYTVRAPDAEPFGPGVLWPNRMPAWQRRDGWVVHSTRDGHWGIYPPGSDRPLLKTEKPHLGAMPDAAFAWQTPVGEAERTVKVSRPAAEDTADTYPKAWAKDAARMQVLRRQEHTRFSVRLRGRVVSCEPRPQQRQQQQEKEPKKGGALFAQGARCLRTELLRRPRPSHFEPYAVECAAGAVSSSGKFVVFGGCRGSDPTQIENEAYQLSAVTAEWSRIEGRPHVPYGRHGHTLTPTGPDQFIVIGGIGTGGGVGQGFGAGPEGDLSELTEQDLLGGFWAQGAPPVADQAADLLCPKSDRWGAAIRSGEGRCFAQLGRPGEECDLGMLRARNGEPVSGRRVRAAGFVRHLYRLDAARGDWRLLISDRRAYVAYHAAAQSAHEVYIFGGIGRDYRCSGALKALDVGPWPAAAPGAAGGLPEGGRQLRQRKGSFFWRDVPADGEPPAPRHSHTMVAAPNELLVFGGHGGEAQTDGPEHAQLLPPEVYSYCTVRQRWAKLHCAPLDRRPAPRMGHSACFHDGNMIIVGGSLGQLPGSLAGYLSDEVWTLSLADQHWRPVRVAAGMPRLKNHVSCVLHNVAGVAGPSLVLFGGWRQELDTWEMARVPEQPSTQQWDPADVELGPDADDLVEQLPHRTVGPVVKTRSGWYLPNLGLKPRRDGGGDSAYPPGLPRGMMRWRGTDKDAERMSWVGPLRTTLVVDPDLRFKAGDEPPPLDHRLIACVEGKPPYAGSELGSAAAPEGSKVAAKEEGAGSLAPALYGTAALRHGADRTAVLAVLEHLVSSATFVIPLERQHPRQAPRQEEANQQLKKSADLLKKVRPWEELDSAKQDRLEKLLAFGKEWRAKRLRVMLRETAELKALAEPKQLFTETNPLRPLYKAACYNAMMGSWVKDHIPAELGKAAEEELKRCTNELWQSCNKIKVLVEGAFERAQKVERKLSDPRAFPVSELASELDAAEKRLQTFTEILQSNKPQRVGGIDGKLPDYWVHYLEGELPDGGYEKKFGGEHTEWLDDEDGPTQQAKDEAAKKHLADNEGSVHAMRRTLKVVKVQAGKLIKKSPEQACEWADKKVQKWADSRQRAADSASRVADDDVQSKRRRLHDQLVENASAVARERERATQRRTKRSVAAVGGKTQELRISRGPSQPGAPLPLEDWGWRLADEGVSGPVGGALGTCFRPSAVLRGVRPGSAAARCGAERFCGVRVTHVLGPGLERPALVTSRAAVLAALDPERPGVEVYCGRGLLLGSAAELAARLGVTFTPGTARVASVEEWIAGSSERSAAWECGVAPGMELYCVAQAAPSAEGREPPHPAPTATDEEACAALMALLRPEPPGEPRDAVLRFRTAPLRAQVLWVGWGWRLRGMPGTGKYERTTPAGRTEPGEEEWSAADGTRRLFSAPDGRWFCGGAATGDIAAPATGDLRTEEPHGGRMPYNGELRWQYWDAGSWRDDPTLGVQAGATYAVLRFEGTQEKGSTVVVERRRLDTKGYEGLGAVWGKGPVKGPHLVEVREGSAAQRAGLGSFIGRRLTHVDGKPPKRMEAPQVAVDNAVQRADRPSPSDVVAVRSAATAGDWTRGTVQGVFGEDKVFAVVLDGAKEGVEFDTTLRDVEVVPWRDNPPPRTISVRLAFAERPPIRVRLARRRAASAGPQGADESAAQVLRRKAEKQAKQFVAGYTRPQVGDGRSALGASALRGELAAPLDALGAMPAGDAARARGWAVSAWAAWLVQRHCAALAHALPGQIAQGERLLVRDAAGGWSPAVAAAGGAPPPVRRDGAERAELPPGMGSLRRDPSCSMHFLFRPVTNGPRRHKGPAPSAAAVAEALLLRSGRRSAADLGVVGRPYDVRCGQQAPSGGVLRFQSTEHARRAAACADAMLLPSGAHRVRVLARPPHLPPDSCGPITGQRRSGPEGAGLHPTEPAQHGVGEAGPAAPPPPPPPPLPLEDSDSGESGEEQRGAGPWLLPYSVGDHVRARRTIEFDQGQVVRRGTVGVVTKVPGSVAGSPAQVQIGGVLFSANDSDVEPDDKGTAAAPKRPRGPLAVLQQPAARNQGGAEWVQAPARWQPPPADRRWADAAAFAGAPAGGSRSARSTAAADWWAAAAGPPPPPRSGGGAAGLRRSASLPQRPAALQPPTVPAPARAVPPPPQQRRGSRMTPGEQQIAAARQALAAGPARRRPGGGSTRGAALAGYTDFHPPM
eukprot:TRINITY_DN2701_c1_g1_i1.p1 TRINITY_DN2701_c1_g1~~TRINITY_DN2701_c1_g1_i1.p1  ORF type:complete len:2527 (+),score=786.08 TRINITY_DN2701_c1_g1_i1:117-7583(+)